jgi:predicted ribosome quality control (RQC) complex YloA/Tae2 family protein
MFRASPDAESALLIFSAMHGHELNETQTRWLNRLLDFLGEIRTPEEVAVMQSKVEAKELQAKFEQAKAALEQAKGEAAKSLADVAEAAAREARAKNDKEWTEFKRHFIPSCEVA